MRSAEHGRECAPGQSKELVQSFRGKKIIKISSPLPPNTHTNQEQSRVCQGCGGSQCGCTCGVGDTGGGDKAGNVKPSHAGTPEKVCGSYRRCHGKVLGSVIKQSVFCFKKVIRLWSLSC